MTTHLTLAQEFSSAHFYAQPVWDEARNRAEFGRCFTAFGHGHNYRVEATFPASIDQPMALAALTRAIHEFDHEHLNFVIPEFKTPPAGKPALVPTTENIGIMICRRLEASGYKPQKVRLYEVSDLWVEVIP